MLRCTTLIAVVLIVGACFTDAAAALNDELIRCKVCQRAISHVFHAGIDLRDHCEKPGRTDPRCDYSNVHQFGIEEMVHTVCDDLPKTYKAIHESEFDLVLHDDPQHPREVAMAIKRSCVRWVHDQHDAVALYIFANIDAGKSAQVVLPSLVERFCRNPCDASYRKQRDAHDHHRHTGEASHDGDL